MFIRAGSVLTETEEPAVLEQFFKAETEVEPIYEETLEPLKNRNRISEPRVPEFNQFHGKIDEIYKNLSNSGEFKPISRKKLIEKCKSVTVLKLSPNFLQNCNFVEICSK